MKTACFVLALMTAGCRPPRSEFVAPLATSAPVGASFRQNVDFAKWGQPYRVGDRVMLKLTATRGRQATTRYLQVELTADVDRETQRETGMTWSDGSKFVLPLAPPIRRTQLTVYDETGRTLRQSRGELYERALPHGLYAMRWLPDVASRHAAHAVSPPSTRPTSPEIAGTEAAVALAMNSLASFSQGTGNNPVLSDLMRDVIELPSIFSMLFRPQLSVEITSVKPVRTLIAGHEMQAAELKFEFRIGDKRALVGDIVAVPASPPLGVVAGIVSVQAQHPIDLSRRLTVELESAQLGSGEELEIEHAPDSRDLRSTH
jgi:hypothetical protein